MSNLPITSSTPQTAAASKQANNTNEAVDASIAQPFGEVLARQINEPLTKDGKDAAADEKLAADVLAQLGTDIKDSKKDAADLSASPDTALANDTSALPADMLAALLPQAMNTTTASTAVSVSGARTDGVAIGSGKAEGKRDSTALKMGTASGIQTSVAPRSTTPASEGVQPKEMPAATTLPESAMRTSSITESNNAAREALIAAAQQPLNTPQSNAAALASLQNTAASIAASSLQPVQLTISTPVNQNKWSDEFTQKITWLASSNQDQTAELHLNPPQLGPLDVVIKVSGDQATALFTSPHAAVREVVEQALPKLRDMLADSGITLGNATVSDQAARDQGQSDSQRSSARMDNDIRDVAPTNNSAARVSQISRHNGIVDTFA